MISRLTFILLLFTSVAQADPLLTSWLTQNSGKYARIYGTTANRTSGTSATTWTNHTSPAYSDVYELYYSNSWVYVKTTGLPSYITGPWLNPQGAVGSFYPQTQSVIRRFPRSPAVQSGTKDNTPAAQSGFFVNGLAAYNALDGWAWDGSADTGGAQHFSSTYFWHRVAPVAESYNFDYTLGHQTPGGVYHNHQDPIALRYQLGDFVTYNSSTKNYSVTSGTPTAHSPIIGWANDGYPIYGPYGYSTATDSSSGIRRMVSGYVKRNGATTGVDNVTTTTTTMPSWYTRFRSARGYTTTTTTARSTNTGTYPIGTYAQDWAYLGDLIKTGSTYYAQGTDFDLNEYNVRYCVTPEFPSGTWAYFITLDSSGAATYPYVFGFEFYGDATGGTVTSISETVTTQHLGGAATPITFTSTPSASGGTVTMTWNSAEGSTYTVEKSTNQSSWTSVSTSTAAASNATQTSSTFPPIGNSGTEYARVTRTAVAAYDLPSVGAAVTTSQTATGTYLAGANNAPTLTSFSTLSGATNGSAFTIDYATLAAAADEADADGNAISFRVEAVSNGTLTKSGSAVTAGSTLLSTGESLVWTPSGTGTIQAFTVKAYDGFAASSTAVAVNVSVSVANTAPTLTTISTLTGATEDTAFTISYATLAAAADEADVDGNAISFRVEALSNGTLTKSGSAVTAGSTLLSTGESLVWTPSSNANGTLAAFTVKAYDGVAASSTAVTVNVSVSSVNDAPTLTTISTLTGATAATAFTITYTTLAAAADESDVDGTTPSFRVEAVSSGTLTKGGTAVTAGSTTLASGESLVWTSAAGASGTVAAFTVKAYDGTAASSTAVAVNVSFSGAGTTDVRLSSWYTSNSGKYARISETDSEAVAGTTKTTWTRTSGSFTLTQATPTYAGLTQIDYSTSWVYVRTGSLGTYNMGPWYNTAARSDSALFINVPKNQGLIIRIPRAAGTIPTTKTQINGLSIGGVQQPAAGWLVDGVSIYDPTDGFSYANGAEAGPGTGQWHRDAYVNEGFTFDYSFAHQQNTGFYHNHVNPIALRYQLGDAVSFNTSTKKYAETMAPTAHSPIIGWMIDGLPIYGPYGYSTATDPNSGVRRMVAGFVKRDGTTTGVDNISATGATRALPAWMLRNNGNTAAAGPNVSTTYPFGRYIQDWAYLGDLTKAGGGTYQQGTDFDLNEYNVRYCVTPEFPSGTYAYFLNISSTGTPQFPYICNRWFYGTPTGGKVNSIAETVTTYHAGGPNRALEITNATVTSPNVTLTWNAVEGGTYSVDASSNNSTWTSKATGLTVSAANTKSNTHATLGASGTEYARVNRTALTTYDTTGVVTPTVAQTTSSSFNLGSTPAAPTLTTISTITGATEDTAFTLSYATLATAADEADANGDAISFRIEAVSSGTLTKNSVAVTAGSTLISSGDSVVWTPAANANGTLAAFTVKAYDGALASTTSVQVNVSTAAVSDGSVWTGGAGTGDWGIASNWADNALPLSTEIAVFNGATPKAVTLGADRSVAGLSIQSNFPNYYTITGNTLTLGSAGITTADGTGGLNPHSISSNIALGANATFNTSNYGQLSINGAISGSASLTKTGVGILNLNGGNTYTGGTIVNEGSLNVYGSILGNTSVAVGCVISIFNSADLSYAGQISGAGSFGKGYAGNLTLTATGHALTGGFSVSGGSVTLANNISATFGDVSISNDASFIVGSGDTLTLGNVEYGSEDTQPAQFIIGGNASVTATTISLGKFSDGSSDILSLGSGANLSTLDAYLADTALSTGNVSITGGVWTNTNTLRQSSGASTDTTVNLTISDSGAVNAPGITKDGAWTTILNTGAFNFTNTSATTAANAWTFSGSGVISNTSAVTLSGVIGGGGALTKTGAGTLTLTGTHTRTGNTTVSAGTLSLSTASLADAADVDLATGATLDLNFTGADTIDKLIIDKVPQAPGTWGSLTSTATNKTARITGNGLLNVSKGPSAFETWASAMGLDGGAGAEAGFSDDPDSDGVKNGLEFVLGGDPLEHDDRITGEVAGNYLTVTFTRNDASEGQVALTVQYGNDLSAWTSVPVGTASSGPNANGVIVSVVENADAEDDVTVSIPVGSNVRMFVQLRVEQ